MTKKSRLIGFLTTSLLVTSTLVSTGSSADSQAVTPADWLARMVTAPAKTTYKGAFVYESVAGISTVRIFHSSGNMQRERLVYQDGPYREIVREGDKIAVIGPNGGVSQSRAEGINVLVERLGHYQDDLRHSYRLLLAGNDRVAGRDALRIGVQPRDEYRYGYQLWLDRETGLLLRSELTDRKGAALERLHFVDFSVVAELPAQGLEPSRAVSWHPNTPQTQEMPDPAAIQALTWETGWMPPGFALAGIGQTNSPPVRNLPQNKEQMQKVDTLLFSDGLATFSLFVAQGQSEIASSGSKQLGATAAISRPFHQGDNYFNVTVVGEIPVGVAERIAAAVRAKQ